MTLTSPPSTNGHLVTLTRRSLEYHSPAGARMALDDPAWHVIGGGDLGRQTLEGWIACDLQVVGIQPQVTQLGAGERPRRLARRSPRLGEPTPTLPDEPRMRTGQQQQSASRHG
jgi:hypothetical protein